MLLASIQNRTHPSNRQNTKSNQTLPRIWLSIGEELAHIVPYEGKNKLCHCGRRLQRLASPVNSKNEDNPLRLFSERPYPYELNRRSRRHQIDLDDINPNCNQLADNSIKLFVVHLRSTSLPFAGLEADRPTLPPRSMYQR